MLSACQKLNNYIEWKLKLLKLRHLLIKNTPKTTKQTDVNDKKNQKMFSVTDAITKQAIN